ncbi:MAG: hypothetical protein AAGC65_17485 [Mucilaginibacter sp.]|uniref:hypothetical protein n=1 Tax=Mucilaginibacter sp. TaxID=1882438 RepID=UPI0031B38EF5
MNDLFYSSKDEIRNRVLKNARDYWGIKNTADFDPMVKLLIEVLSTELFNISNQVNNLENRMVDKISGILASDTLISAIPAHAILQAKPIEDVEIIDESTQFFYGKRLADKDENNKETTLDIFFSPLKPVKIFNAEVAYLATGSSLFQVDGQQNKTLLGQSIPGRTLEKNAVFIGINVPNELVSLDGFSFYFDWRNYKVEKQTYDLLSFSEWFVNEERVKVSHDKFYQEPTQHSRSPFDDHNILNLISRDVQAFYRNRFLTITDTRAQQAPVLELYPKQFEQIFQATNLSGLNRPILWIKVIVPVTVNQTILNELSVAINAFPVVNKKLHDLKHRLKMMNDIIPLKLSAYDQFLNVESLRDNLGNHYTEIPQGYDQERSSGLFSVRYGGSERFDNRNAKEILDYLFELLRDEKAAFAAYGTDFLETSLKELEQNISMISQKTMGRLSSIKELFNYIILKPLNNADIMFLEFWTSNAELGNNIRAGSRLQAFESTKIIAESLFLLSTTQGGRSRLNATNRVRAYKYGLTTGDRIVTQADIVNFCFWELGSNISDVKISKGLMNSSNPKEGFIKTVDIIITPAQQSELKPQEWLPVLELTRSKLETRSTMNLNYRFLLASEN